MKLSKAQAKQNLIEAGIDFNEDFHTLPSSKVDLIIEAAKACGYKKPVNANGSTGRYFFQALTKD
jgi:hypothetical protein